MLSIWNTILFRNSPNDKITIITNYDQIPSFENETEEANFWDTHMLSDELWEQGKQHAKPLNLPQRRKDGSKSITFCIEDNTLERLKVLAEHKSMDYQALLKIFVQERIYEEEKREGFIVTDARA